MRILIDIGHPAHVHLFRFFAEEMKSKGHQIIFTVREKENELRLLTSFNMPYNLLGRHNSSLLGKVFSLLVSILKTLEVARRFKPDLFLSHGSIIAAVTSWLYRKPHISLEDTGNNEQVRLYLPFTEAVLTSSAFHKNYGHKQVRYNGFHELAYLHPRYFTIDKQFKKQLNALEGEKYTIVRFVSWNATHDKSGTGLSDIEKSEIVKRLSLFGKVFVSSEHSLPDELVKYRYPLPPETIHQALANADLFIGEGATMASECAVLGTPAIYINSQIAGTINEQSDYGLVFQYHGFAGTIEKAEQLLEIRDSKEFFHKKRDAMLKDKVDLTRLLVWFVESWPESFKKAETDCDFLDDFISKI